MKEPVLRGIVFEIERTIAETVFDHHQIDKSAVAYYLSELTPSAG